MSHIHLSGSFICAIEEMQSILQGFREDVGCPRPTWCNFKFFGDIKGSSIKRVERKEPTDDEVGHWILSRTVELYFNKKKVAVVKLKGQKLDRTGDNRADGKLTFWGVECIRYAKEAFGSAENDVSPESEWVEHKPETVTMSCRVY